MGRFYGHRYGALKVAMRPVAPRPPVVAVEQSLVAPPTGPVARGSIVPSAPASFPPYQIRPEYVGAPVQKQVVPPYYDPRTAASFSPPTPAVNVTDPAQALPPAAPVQPPWMPRATQTPSIPSASDRTQQIFRSATAQKVSQAIASQQAAAAANAQADQAAQAATLLADHAAAASAKAAAYPAPRHIRAQDTALLHANTAAHIAHQADLTSQLHNQQAQADTEAANEALAKSGQTVTSNGTIVPAVDDGYTGQVDPGSVMPTGSTTDDGSTQPVPEATFMPPPAASSGHPVVVAASAAAAGFLLGGPVGALVGLLGGGAYAYHQNSVAQAQSDAAAQVAAQTAAAATTEAAATLPSGGAAAMSSLRGFYLGRW